jgi:hypothetical protein
MAFFQNRNNGRAVLLIIEESINASIHRPGFRQPGFPFERAHELVDLLCALFDALRLADFPVAPQGASFFEQLFAVLRSAQLHVGYGCPLVFGSHE